MSSASRWTTLLAVCVCAVGCLGVARAHETQTSTSGLRAMTLEEMSAVRGQMTRQGYSCNQRGWAPCTTKECYWHTGAQQCRVDAAYNVPACQDEEDDDYECRIDEDPPFACCFIIYQCNGNSQDTCAPPAGGELGNYGCDYRNCQTFYQGQPMG